MILLESDKIQAHLSHLNFKKTYQLHCFSSINSTNQFLNDLTSKNLLTLCCSEEQTAGRGRFGRQWSSPFGENIYLSGRWRLANSVGQLSGLSLVIGLALVQSLKKHATDEKILVKWPNDVLWQNKKLGGILIELNGSEHGVSDVTIGIGLNVNSASNTSTLSDKPWCSLLDITGRTFDRNTLIADLVVSVDRNLDQFLESGFDSFKSAWDDVDYLKNQWITVSQATGKLSGKAQGVNAQGLLCIKDSHDKIHYVSSGDATLSCYTQET